MTEFKVALMEYERGWGNRIDEIKTFNDHESAVKFIKEFNAYNDKFIVPDWYMVAQPMNFKINCTT